MTATQASAMGCEESEVRIRVGAGAVLGRVPVVTAFAGVLQDSDIDFTDVNLVELFQLARSSGSLHLGIQKDPT